MGWIAVLALVGCGVDRDGDGVLSSHDCDDRDSAVGEAPTWYADQDGDGFGRGGSTRDSCGPVEGFASAHGDCDDHDASAHPGAAEHCDGIDQDCDDLIDEDAADAATWYFDQDLDGYGDPDVEQVACDRPEGWSPTADDCDDLSEASHPGADEVCDEEDNDCDGEVDDDDSLGQSTWFLDADGDGHGDPDYAVEGCAAPDGWVESPEDCDDSSAEASPDLTEENCDDGLDNDCDGVADSCGLRGEQELDRTEGRVVGLNSNDLLGTAVAGVGDVDRDGIDDILLGAPQADHVASNGGGAYLIAGPLTGRMPSTAADATLTGSSSNGNAGAALAAAGDLDGDLFADLLVAAPNVDGGKSDSGMVYVVHGPVTGSVSLNSAWARIGGEGLGDHAGTALDGAGDVNADGYADLIVGAQDSDSGRGGAFLVNGPVSGSSELGDARAILRGRALGDAAGASVAGVGDTDGDGFDDLLVGAPHQSYDHDDAGEVYLLRGPVSGVLYLDESDASWAGGAGQVLLGSSVAAAGDLDLDGYDDMLLGAPGQNDGAGRGYVIYGPVDDAEDVADVVGSQFNGGSAMAAGETFVAPGDLDQDGYPDLAIGAPDHADSRGAVFFLYGPSEDWGTTDLSLVGARRSGDADGDAAGAALAPAGDTNDDGFPDLIVGAAGNDETGTGAGQAYLLLGGGF